MHTKEAMLNTQSKIYQASNISEVQQKMESHHSFEQHAGSVLSDTAIYRQLAEQLEKLIGEDKSLRQALVIQAKDVDDDILSIPTKRSSWENAHFIQSKTPPDEIQGRIIKNVTFGYSKGTKFIRMGTIPWIAISADGVISYVGLPENPKHADLLEVLLKEQIFGFNVSSEFTLRQQELYHHLFKTLNRPFSKSSTLCKEFFSKRKHLASWRKKGKFAYYDPDSFNEKLFKQRHGYTDDDLYRAGIMEISVSKDGKVIYSKRTDECVLIPYFKKDKKNGRLSICSWRMRIINPHSGPKYLSHPLIRSYMKSPSVEEEMYNSHLLDQSKGKDIFFTEGEFKCHVSTQKSGYLTIGIPGITMVTDAMLDRLINSGATSITLALDADTRAKSVKRVDAITDSERAAYEIAWRYQRRVSERLVSGTLPNQIPTMKIGLLQVTTDGDKQGLDDWLIPMSDKNSKTEMENLRNSALTLSQYASAIGLPNQGLNESLAQIRIHRTEIRAILRSAQNYIERTYGTQEYPEDRTFQNIKNIKQTLEGFLSDLDSTQSRGLWSLYNRNRFNLPGQRFRFLASKEVPRADKKAIYHPESKTNFIAKASGDIVCSEIYFSDMPQKERAPDAEGQTLPYSMKEVMNYFCGIQSKEEIFHDFTRGIVSLELEKDVTQIFQRLQKNRDLHQFCKILIAGFLSRSFRNDEYSFSQALACIYRGDRFIEEFTKIDLAIFSKKKDLIEMIVSPVYWTPKVLLDDSSSPFRGYYHSSSLLTEADITYLRQNNPTNPQRASLIVGSKSARVRSFLRNPILDSQKAKFNRIVEIMTNDPVGRQRAHEYWSQYGLSQSAIDAAKLSILDRQDSMRLARLLDEKSLLNQAIHAGFFRLKPDGSLAAAFNGPISLLPSRDRNSVSIRIGVTEADKENKRIEPTKKRFYVLKGARSTAPSMDPTSHLFFGTSLSHAKNKSVILCYNEHDAIVLRYHLPRSKYVVVGLNSDLTPRSKIIASIKQSGCLNAVVIGRPNSDRRYEGLVLEPEIPIEFFEILDLERRFNSVRKGETPVQLSWVPLSCDLSEWVKLKLDENSGKSLSEDLAAIIDLQTQIPSQIMLSYYGITPSKYSAIVRLSRIREEYELLIESTGIPNLRTIEKFSQVANKLSNQLQEVSKIYKKSYNFPTTIEEYLSFAYPWIQLPLPTTTNNFIEFKQKYPQGVPLRRIFRSITTPVKSQWPKDSENQIVDLISPLWSEKSIALNIDSKAKLAAKTDYKSRLREILSIALRHKIITHLPNQHSNLYSIKVFGNDSNQQRRAIIKEHSDSAIGNKGLAIRGLKFAQIEFIRTNGDSLLTIQVNGHARSKENAEQLAAQFAFKYLGNIKTKDGSKLKSLWYEKYERPRIVRIREQKKEKHRQIGHTVQIEIELSSGKKRVQNVHFRKS